MAKGRRRNRRRRGTGAGVQARRPSGGRRSITLAPPPNESALSQSARAVKQSVRTRLRPSISMDLLWSVPAIALTAAVGLGLIGLADANSRAGSSPLGFLFWLGLLLLFAPVAFRTLSPGASRRDRLLLMLLLGVGLYLVKVLASPTSFTFIDEFIHLRTTQDILTSHHLFGFNPLLPASAMYPGLEIATSEIVDTAHVSPFVAGLILIGVARVVFVTSFFSVAERASGSSRGAAAASLIYFGNPMFLFWSSYFSYENLALPLAAFTIWWIMRVRSLPSPAALLISAALIAAVAVTHHVASFALAALLVAWWLVERLAKRRSREVSRVGLMALLAILASGTWLLTAARPAIAYLWVENIYPGISETLSVLTGHLPLRTLYSSAGASAPLWERATGFGGVLVILLALPVGAYLAWRLRSVKPALLVAGAAAIAYPLSLVPRLAPDGVAISGRSSEYLYAGIGCLLGLILSTEVAQNRPKLARWFSRRPWANPSGLLIRHVPLVAAALTCLVFIGGVTVGTPYNEILPEAATTSGYPWSAQPGVVAAAHWARQHLGANRRFAASAVDAPVLGSDGGQYAVSENFAWPIYFSSSLDAQVVKAIKLAKVDYVFADRALTQAVPENPSYYFSPYEPDGGFHKHPLPASYLSKFAQSTCVSTIYWSKQVQIYDVSAILDGSCIPSTARG